MKKSGKTTLNARVNVFIYVTPIKVYNIDFFAIAENQSGYPIKCIYLYSDLGVSIDGLNMGMTFEEVDALCKDMYGELETEEDNDRMYWLDSNSLVCFMGDEYGNLRMLGLYYGGGFWVII